MRLPCPACCCSRSPMPDKSEGAAGGSLGGAGSGDGLIGAYRPPSVASDAAATQPAAPSKPAAPVGPLHRGTSQLKTQSQLQIKPKRSMSPPPPADPHAGADSAGKRLAAAWQDPRMRMCLAGPSDAHVSGRTPRCSCALSAAAPCTAFPCQSLAGGAPRTQASSPPAGLSYTLKRGQSMFACRSGGHQGGHGHLGRCT